MSESELVPTGRWVSSPEVGYCPVMSSSSPAANAGLVRITYLGQSTFRFTTPESKIVLIDPWTIGNPLCPPDEKEVREVDLILITHAHHDHEHWRHRAAGRGHDNDDTGRTQLQRGRGAIRVRRSGGGFCHRALRRQQDLSRR